MSRGPEGKTQDSVIKYAREKYGANCKKNEVGRFFVGSGWPDYFVLPDQTKYKKIRLPFFIEFKAPGGALTPLQQLKKSELESCGYKVYVVDSVPYGKIVVDQELS